MKGNPEQFYQATLENIPNAVFFLLPIFALILKLFYIRSHRLFIEHLIFALHLHSFAFFISLFPIFTELFTTQTDMLELLAILVILIYAFFAFKNVYEQNYRKTTVKFLLIITVYSFCLAVAMFLEIMISLLIF